MPAQWGEKLQHRGNRNVFFFICFLVLRRNCRKGETWCDMFDSIKWVQNILCRDAPRAELLGRGLAFLSFSNWVLVLHLHALNVVPYEREGKTLLNKQQTASWDHIQIPPANGSFWPSVIRVCVCVWDSMALHRHRGPETTSPAGSRPHVLLEIKQGISALRNKHTQVFWSPVCCQQLHPITFLQL